MNKHIVNCTILSCLFAVISTQAIAQKANENNEIASPWDQPKPVVSSHIDFVDLTDEKRYQPQSATSTIAPPAAPEVISPVSSFFRVDHDYSFGLQLWAGATHSITNNFGISTDIFIAEAQLPAFKGASYSWYGEFDIGPAFSFGKLSMTPMVGIGMDWAARRAVVINGPQLYTILNTDKIYVESWMWLLLYSPFKDAPSPDVFHTRNWILYKLGDVISVGPQLEIWANTKQKTIADIGFKSGIFSMPIGGHVDIDYNSGNTLGIFLGYESNKDGRMSRNGNGAVGRFTYIHNF